MRGFKSAAHLQRFDPERSASYAVRLLRGGLRQVGPGVGREPFAQTFGTDVRDSDEEVPMIAIKHVLVATDFSPPSNTALNYGRAMARTFGATLHVLHVLEAVPRTVGGEFGIADTGGLTEELKLAARRELDSVVDDDDRRDLHAKPVLAIASHAAAEITAYAANEPVDIIIMGTHGRGALAKILMGSVAERVVRTAPCPVLTVRHSPA